MAIKQQEIINAMKIAFQGIKIANGYYTNAGDNVFEWYDLPIGEDRFPALSIRDVRDEKVIEKMKGGDQYVEIDMTVEIEVLTMGTLSPGDVRKAKHDVYKAIRADKTWGGLAINTSLIGNEMVVDQKEKMVMGNATTILVRYQTKNFDET